MKKNYFFLLALAGAVLVSCSQSDFDGDGVATDATPNATGAAIGFNGGSGKITRATSNTGSVSQMLDGQFKVYGVKHGTSYSDVFQNYVVWSSNTQTVSNPDQDWEYVGAPGTTYGTAADNLSLASAQTIKYWDYSTDVYHFVAGSPVANFTYTKNASGDIESATVTGLAGHINPNSGTSITTNPVYIADPVAVAKADYKKEVTFSFKRQQSFVRVGIYETIPGYSISAIEFYSKGASGWTAPTGDNKNNIILASTTANYFRGATSGSGTITYDWSGATPTYTYAYSTDGLTQAKNWYGGKLASGVPAQTSTESTVANLYGTDADMASTGYFTVIPMASASEAAPILIKCNYTLTSDDNSGETITVTGATAAIPAAYSKWNANTSYTYLFKISDNTNGSTGTPGTDPDGLFPITFDALVLAEENGTKQGTITTVATPSITTYQQGSVTAAGIAYSSGTAIYVTVEDNTTGALNTLTAYDATETAGMVRVYKLAGAQTEADLQLIRPTTAFNSTIGAAAFTVNGQSLAAGKYVSFTPDAAGYYAVEYVVSPASGPDAAVYAYKVIKVG